MGVFGLLKFMKSREEFHKTESLIRLVEEHRNNTETRPLVIIDGRAMCHKLFGESSPVLYDYAQVHRSLSKLSTLLTSLDVDIEVHFVGGSQDHEYYLNKIKGDVECRIYHMKRIHEVRPLWFLYNLTGRSYSDVIRFIFGHYFKVVNSLARCETGLIEYARSRNCLAIISHDFTFMFQELDIQCWYDELLNYTDRTVTLFNVPAFAMHLGFNVDHMPFVLAIFGNHVLTWKKLAESYGNPKEFMDKLNKISDALAPRRHLTLQQLREAPNFEVLLDEMFPQADDKVSLYQDFARSVAVYVDFNCIEELIEQDNVLQHVKTMVELNKIQPSFFYLLKDKKFYDLTGFQCISKRQCQYGRVMEIYTDLRKRLYYLLFRDVDCIIQEYWAKYNMEHDTVEMETKEINPEPAEFDISLSLLELWQNEDDSDLKWKILVHSISSTIVIDQFRNLSTKYYYPVLTLHYLLNLPDGRVIENWEADVFLCHLALRDKVSEAPGLNPRALELINIYNSGLTFICYLVAAAGFPISIQMLMESNSQGWNFDGKAFYNAYCHLEKRDRDMITDDMSTEPRRLLGLI